MFWCKEQGTQRKADYLIECPTDGAVQRPVCRDHLEFALREEYRESYGAYGEFSVTPLFPINQRFSDDD